MVVSFNAVTLYIKHSTVVAIVITGYMAAAIGVLVITFGIYYKMSQNTIANLNKEVAVQEIRAAIAEKTNDAMRNQIAQQTKALSALAVEQQEIRKQSLRVAEIFSKHDLARLAALKPGLIENRVNAGTKAVLDELRAIE